MMKYLLSNEYIALLLRVLLGLTFLAACIDKIADPIGFAIAIANYKLISGSPALFVATVLPWIELLCALFILAGIFRRGSCLLLTAMLVGFTLGVTSGILRELDISCGCFTLDPTVGKIGWQKVFENSGLILASVVLFFSETTKYRITIE
jgi:putative oxidoreductase